MMMAGLPALSSVVLEHPEDYLSFEKTLKENEATALVVIDDIFALRTMQLAQMYGYVIPETLSVISFNNSIFSTLTHPLPYKYRYRYLRIRTCRYAKAARIDP